MTLAGRHQDHAHHHRQFVAAKGRQHLNGLDHVAVTGLGSLQHRHQVRQVVHVHVGPGHDEVANGTVGQARQDQGCALVRTHTHAGQHGHVALELVADLHACAHAGMGLLQRHGS